MKRVAMPETSMSSVSRQGLVSIISGSIESDALLDFTCQSQVT